MLRDWKVPSGVLLFSQVLVYAATTAPMQFSIFWPCAGNASFCADRVLAIGVIEADSDKKLISFLARHKADLPPRPVICFDSPGGNLAGALALGRAIRALRLDTCLAPEYSRVVKGRLDMSEVFDTDVECASACAFALLGGVNRQIEPGSRLGVHQFSGPHTDRDHSIAQVSIVVLAAYLQEMGVSRSLLDIASLVPQDRIYWLSQDEMRRLNVDNMTPASTDWTLNALDDGTPFVSITQEIPRLRSRLALTIVRIGGRAILFLAFVPEENGTSGLHTAVEVLHASPIRLLVDDDQIAEYPGTAWSLTHGVLVAALPLALRTTDALRSGSVLEVKTQVPHVFEQYDPSVVVRIDGLSRFLTVVLHHGS